MRYPLLSLLLLAFCTTALKAQSVGIGYYNVDGLYDTIPSKFYNDTHFTPEGRNHWSAERYNHKISNIAAVIDSMALPIIGLYGTETEAVVQDVVRHCAADYSYIHRTRNSFDGQDFALIYFGDVLHVDKVEPQRNMLIVEGTLLDCESPITLILSRSGDDTSYYLRHNSYSEQLVIMGKFYRNHIEKWGLVDALEPSERQGYGNYVSYRGWMLYDRIAVSDKRKIFKSGIYITPWLLSPTDNKPLPSYKKDSYIGGYSKYLPIFIYFNQN